MKTPAVLLLTAACLTVSLTGCGAGSDETAPAAPAAPSSTSGPASAELASVVADVDEIAPALESYVRGGTYPQDVGEATAAIAKAGLSLTEGNTLATYVYDPDAVEFRMCVEGPTGAFATYDTAPMTVAQQGDSGGCPA